MGGASTFRRHHRALWLALLALNGLVAIFVADRIWSVFVFVLVNELVLVMEAATRILALIDR
ncbi:hypothetical protein ACQKWADRAFT_293622 [Trichoderma austrokoningii]